MLRKYHILTVSHNEIPLDQLPAYSIKYADPEGLRQVLEDMKDHLDLDELFYLSTCNRVLYFCVTSAELDQHLIAHYFDPSADMAKVLHKQDEDCVSYFMQVASSLHSMVVGEREILKQIRVAFEQQSPWNLIGEHLQLAIQRTIWSAKQVYQHTKIGERSVSIASLAVKKLAHQLNREAEIVLVGAGTTIQLVIKHLKKRGFRHFTIYNRTAKAAQLLANKYNASAGTLDDLIRHTDHFDALIACTSADEPIITYELAHTLAQDRINDVVWVDLGMPGDIERSASDPRSTRMIDLQTLQSLAQRNRQARQGEMEEAKKILEHALETFKEACYFRKVERAFRSIPAEVRSVKEKAYSEVFHKEIAQTDQETQALISRMMDYMEKKCIGIPMKAAKKAIIQ